MKKNIKDLKKILIDFEKDIKETYEKGKIKAPIHLSGNNELPLIKIFKQVKKKDWVFSSWRNHYHAILHGVDRDYLADSIRQGLSMGTNSVEPNFYSSSIVGGIIPIALGAAKALQMKNSSSKV